MSNAVTPQAGALSDLVEAAGSAGSQSADTWRGKRSVARRALVVPVRISVMTDKHLGPPRIYSLRNISDSGVGIQSPVSFKTREHVWVELCVGNTTWGGHMQVVHCTQTVGGYKVGLEVRDAADSPTAERPRHQWDPTPDPTPALRNALHERWLTKAKAEICDAIRAYDLARRSWGLLGTSIRKEIRKVVRAMPGTSADVINNCRRQYARMRSNVDVATIALINNKWRRIPAVMINVSEDGVALCLPSDLIDDPIERELAGECRVRPNMVMILGLGTEPKMLWVPAEVLHCRKLEDGVVQAGARFVTPKSLEIFNR